MLVHGVPTLAITYFFKSLFQIIRGDAGTARRGAEIAVKLSQENGLTLFAALGALQSAWVSARLDGRETGATELRQALAASADQGNKLFVVVGLATIVTDETRFPQTEISM